MAAVIDCFKAGHRCLVPDQQMSVQGERNHKQTNKHKHKHKQKLVGADCQVLNKVAREVPSPQHGDGGRDGCPPLIQGASTPVQIPCAEHIRWVQQTPEWGHKGEVL